MVPRVPELFVCPESVKKIIEQIEKPAIIKSKPSQADTEVNTTGTGKIKTKAQNATGTAAQRPAVES
jgi:hypothetical protein